MENKLMLLLKDTIIGDDESAKNMFEALNNL